MTHSKEEDPSSRGKGRLSSHRMIILHIGMGGVPVGLNPVEEAREDFYAQFIQKDASMTFGNDQVNSAVSGYFDVLGVDMVSGPLIDQLPSTRV